MMMKKIFAAGLLTVVPLALLAAPAKTAHKAKRLAPSQVEIKSKAVQMAAGIRAAEAALTPAELAIAGRIYQGNMPCELGAFVKVTADPKMPGYFDLQIKNLKYRMVPVVTSTGAIRLEDPQAGAVWLQLSNKSMLMNQKLGQRLADVCMNPEQVVVAERLIKNPAPGLLDAPTVVASVPKPVVVVPDPVPSTPEAALVVPPVPTPPVLVPEPVPGAAEAPLAAASVPTPPVLVPEPAPSTPAAPLAVPSVPTPPVVVVNPAPDALQAPIGVPDK